MNIGEMVVDIFFANYKAVFYNRSTLNEIYVWTSSCRHNFRVSRETRRFNSCFCIQHSLMNCFTSIVDSKCNTFFFLYKNCLMLSNSSYNTAHCSLYMTHDNSSNSLSSISATQLYSYLFNSYFKWM